GTALITLDSIRISSFDACGVASEVLSDTLFDCSDMGINNITLTVTDVNGNSTVLNATVNVIDTTPPTVVVQAESLYLDVNGQAVLDSSLFDLGSFDNCQIATYVISETNFDCDSAGQVLTIGLSVTDVNGNTKDTTVEITVLDTVAPALLVQNYTAQLDSNGDVTINSGLIDIGTNDACGIASLSLSDSIFGCDDVGPNSVTLTAVDVNGNVDSATVTITVEDNIAPSAFTFSSLEVFLNANGEDTIQVADIDSASFDACGIETYSLSDTTFDCSDIGASIIVTLTLTDSNGNVSTSQTSVTVSDVINPVMITQNVTIYLNDSGSASINVPMVDNGSFDNCSIDSVFLSQDSFDCSHTAAPVEVVLYGMDQSGNVDSASAFVTVLDTILPDIVCPNDTVISNDLDACGAVFNYPTPLAYDYCGIDTVTQTDGSGLFSGDVFPVGVTVIEFTALDVNGNLDSCSFTVTVVDTQAPVIFCPSADTSICDSIFTFAPPVTSDNCAGETTVQISGIASGQFYPVGTTTNTFVVTDASGLTDTCSFTVLRYDYPSVAYAGEDTAICELDSLMLSAIEPAIGDGLWTTLTMGTSLQDDTIASTSALNLQYGNNVFVWSVTNGVCAVNYDTLTIRRDETPTTALLPGTVAYCEEEEVMVGANTPTVGVGRWSVLSGGTIADTLSDSTLLEDMIVGDIDIQWTISNGVCPVSRDTQRIVNLLNPTVDIGEDVVAFNGFARQMSPVITDAVAYSWRPQSIFNDTNILDPIATVTTSQTVILFVMNDSGCVASDTALYIVNDLEDIPTGITPNNDNVNDVWNISGMENYPTARVLIYDQAGRKVFESIGYQQPWDGTFNGKPLPRASYYWIIDLQDGINQPLKGIISIIR
ncbi:MAG: gliding motility-associated C-terminal domain-containing protein, partial [Cryomorphaceae bacterium]